MPKPKLQDLTVSIYDRLRNALEKGDKAEGLKLLKELHEANLKMRDFHTGCIDVMLSTLADRLGEDSVYEMWRIIEDRHNVPTVEVNVPEMKPEDRIVRRLWLWSMLHGVGINIKEDDEKYVITTPCDTGRHIRMIPDHGKTRYPHTWSRGEKDFCYYCGHCTISWEIMSAEKYGYPAWVSNPPKKVGQPCVQYLYKDVKFIPEEYFRSIGMVKQAAPKKASARKAVATKPSAREPAAKKSTKK
ncbi:MAG: hypothetical protein Q7T04_04455 [Dehalococcoidia bacterium]|nr:hypothetical protein [Dehalococcoidia bacterium]